MMHDLLKQLALKDPLARRYALLRQLEMLSIPVIEEPLPINGYTPHNIRVPLHHGEPYSIIGAHYDSVSGSHNAAALVILLTILRSHLLGSFLPPIEFVFFDLEEAEMQGSLAYTQHHDLSNVRAMINLDLCGVGDYVLVAEGLRWQYPPLTQAIETAIKQITKVQRIQNIPQSDDYYFEGMHIPTVSICCAPEVDIAKFENLARALRGEIILQNFPTVFETMHNRPRDTVEVVEVDAMQHAYVLTVALMKEFASSSHNTNL